MKKLLLAALMLTGAAPVPPQPLTFWRYGDNLERHTVQDALDCALERWRQAACLPLDVSYDAVHRVRLADAEELGTLAGHTGGTWDAARIRVLRGIPKDDQCEVLTHELSHLLRRSNTHPGLDGTISNVATSFGYRRITAKDIDYVCAKQDCACDNPEP